MCMMKHKWEMRNFANYSGVFYAILQHTSIPG